MCTTFLVNKLHVKKLGVLKWIFNGSLHGKKIVNVKILKCCEFKGKTKMLLPCGVQRFQNEATLIKYNFRIRAFETRFEFIENKCGNYFVIL